MGGSADPEVTTPATGRGSTLNRAIRVLVRMEVGSMMVERPALESCDSPASLLSTENGLHVPRPYAHRADPSIFDASDGGIHWDLLRARRTGLSEEQPALLPHMRASKEALANRPEPQTHSPKNISVSRPITTPSYLDPPPMIDKALLPC